LLMGANTGVGERALVASNFRSWAVNHTLLNAPKPNVGLPTEPSPEFLNPRVRMHLNEVAAHKDLYELFRTNGDASWPSLRRPHRTAVNVGVYQHRILR